MKVQQLPNRRGVSNLSLTTIIALNLGLAVAPFWTKAQAATQTWTGASGTDTNWSTAANWGASVPGSVGTSTSTDVALFTGTTATSTAVTLDASYNIGLLQFGNGAVSGNFTISSSNTSSLVFTPSTNASGVSGDTIRNDVGVPTTSGATYQTISVPVILSNGALTSGTFRFAANGGSATGLSNFLKITGNVTGAATSGTSVLILYGGNNTRSLANPNEIGGIISDGTGGGALALQFQQGNQFGTNGSTTWVLSGSNTYSGGTLINTNGFSGNLEVRNSSALGTGTVSWTASGGNQNVLRFGASGLTLANNMTVASGVLAVLDGVTSNGGTVSGSISGAGGVRIQNGTISLTGNNSYAGATDLGSNGKLSITNLNQINSGAGGITVSGGGSAFDNLTGIASTLSGGLTMSGGDFTLTGTNGANSSVTFSGTSILSGLSAGSTRTVNVNNSAAIVTLAGPLNQTANTAAQGLTIGGSGTLVLGASNNYVGKTVVNSGATLKLGNANSLGGSATANLVTTTGTNTAVVLSGSGNYYVGEVVSGAGIGNGITTITAISSGTNLTLSTSATASGTNSSNFAGATQVNSGGTLDLNGQSVSRAFGSINGTGVGSNGALINSSTNAAAITSTLGNGNSVAAGGFNPGSFTVGGTGQISLDTVASGNGAFTLTKIGAGTLIMGGTADNAFASGVVNGGLLVLNKSGSGHVFNAVTLTSGTMQYGSNTVGLLNGTGQVNGVTINGGVFDLNGGSGNNATIGNLTGSNGVITNNNATAATLTVGGNNAGGGNFTGTVQNGSGTLAISKTGSGTITLSGSNSYSGGTTIGGGTLVMGSATALGSNGASLAANGGTLDLNGNSLSVGALSGNSGAVITSNTTGALILTASSNNPTSFAGSIKDGSATVSFVKNGTGELQLNGSSNYSGGTTVNRGTLRTTAGGTTPAFGTGIIALNSPAGAGTVGLYATASSSLTIANNIVIQSGTQRYEYSQAGSNALNGSITGAAGTSFVVSSGFNPTIQFNGDVTGFNGTLALIGNGGGNAATTNYDFTNTTSVGAPNAAVQLVGYTGTNIGNVTNLRWAGTGDATIPLGALTTSFAAGQSGTNATLQNATAGSTATFQIGGLNTSGTFGGNILDGNGTTAIGKVGSGSLTLSGSSTYTGTTNVNAGKLFIAGSLNGSTVLVNSGATLGGNGGAVSVINVNAGGTLAPGLDSAGASSGALTANGNVSFADSTAHLSIRLGVTTAADGDKLTTGSASAVVVSLNGADLQLTLGTGYSHVDNQLFLILNNANNSSILSGNFAQGSQITASYSGGTETFNIIYGANYDSNGNFVSLAGGNDIVLEAVAVPEPGTWVMLLGGVGILGLNRRLRRRL